MASENRQLPKSNITRLTALNKGKEKNDLEGSNSFISTPVQTLLNTNQDAFKKKSRELDVAKAEYSETTAPTEKSADDCRMIATDFIIVFNRAIRRGIFKKSDLNYYGLTMDGNVPDMSSQDKIATVTQDLVEGDAERMAAGGVAMAMPTIAEVAAELATFTENRILHNKATEKMKKAQRDLNALISEADTTIKSFWGEIETHYINLEPSAQRDECKLWGIVYTRVGSDKKISGSVVDVDTNEPIVGVEIYFDNGNNVAESTTNGFSLNTTLMDDQKLLATHPLYIIWEEVVMLKENENLVVSIKMKKK